MRRRPSTKTNYHMPAHVAKLVSEAKLPLESFHNTYYHKVNINHSVNAYVYKEIVKFYNKKTINYLTNYCQQFKSAICKTLASIQKCFDLQLK